MQRRSFLTSAAATLALLAIPGAALAKKKKNEGTSVTVRVVDEDGEPVPTAVIRHPDEADRHRVNSVDGTWDEEVLYLPDGTELIFEPGLLLYLEVSAPGYQTQVVQYQVRRRKNRFDVVLEKIDMVDDELEAPMLQFGRDTPRDGVGGGPAN